MPVSGRRFCGSAFRCLMGCCVLRASLAVPPFGSLPPGSDCQSWGRAKQNWLLLYVFAYCSRARPRYAARIEDTARRSPGPCLPNEPLGMASIWLRVRASARGFASCNSSDG